MNILHICLQKGFCLQKGQQQTRIYIVDGTASYVTHEYKDTGIIIECLRIEHAKSVRVIDDIAESQDGITKHTMEDVSKKYFDLYGSTDGDRVNYCIPWEPGIGRQIHIDAWREDDDENREGL